MAQSAKFWRDYNSAMRPYEETIKKTKREKDYPEGPERKRCPKCGEIKSIHDKSFSKCVSAYDGLQTECLICQSARRKKWYYDHKAHSRKYKREWDRRQRELKKEQRHKSVNNE